MAITDELVCCDMCVLSYQLYHQSVIWPLDPWYEFLARTGSDRRTLFMKEVHDWATVPANVDKPTNTRLKSGPGKLRGWSSNPTLDPIITNYKLINPQLPGWSRDDSQHVVVRAPNYITDSIGKVALAVYTGDPTQTGTPWATSVEVRPLANRDRAGTDYLIGFEGVAGIFGDKGGVWSLMGYVLKRVVEGGAYDVYIVFRGSRSGHALRAVKEGAGSHIGNADWVSDTDPEYVTDTSISQFGQVARGFANSVRNCLATIRAACQAINTQSNNVPPRQIFVTGHSLGAALAAQFCAACNLGLRWSGYLDSWPWKSLKGRFFALPPVGNPEFIEKFDARITSKHIWVHGDMVVEVGKGYWERGKGADIAKWMSKLPADSGQVGVALRLPLPPAASENPHEMFIIRWGMARNHNSAGVDAAYVNLQPWATYETFSDVLAGANHTYYNGKHPIITKDNLLALLENYNFANEFRVFQKLFRKLILNPKIYKLSKAFQTVNGRQLKLEQFVQAIETRVPSKSPIEQEPGAPELPPRPPRAPQPPRPPHLVKEDVLQGTLAQVKLLMEVQGVNTGKYFGLGVILSNFQNSPVPIPIADFAKLPELKACLDHKKQSTT